jgi:gluconolactonase
MLLTACAGNPASSATTTPSVTPAPSVAITHPEPTAPPEATAAPANATLSLIASGAKVETVAEGLELAEGPVWLPDGRLVVSDVYGNAVVVFDGAGNQSDLRRPSNVANGHALDLDGTVVEADSGDKTIRGAITRIAVDGSATILADNYQGKRFNAPNDLTVTSDGAIWFTDPDYNQQITSEIGFNGVYRLDPQTKTVTLLTRTLSEPNGIAFSPDEKTLYITNSATNTLVSFPVAPDETLGASQRLGDGCDGIGVDEQGNIWTSTCDDRIVITSPEGRRIGAITFPGTTTNLAWGGADGKTLFVTTQEGGVYSLALTVQGTH